MMKGKGVMAFSPVGRVCLAEYFIMGCAEGTGGDSSLLCVLDRGWMEDVGEQGRDFRKAGSAMAKDV